jgi:hypothetical protein
MRMIEATLDVGAARRAQPIVKTNGTRRNDMHIKVSS